MSELRETVCTAIENGARNHAALIEATGLEAKQVSNILFALRQAGRVTKRPGGFFLTSESEETTPVEAPAGDVAPPPARAGKKTKLRKAKHRVKPAVAPARTGSRKATAAASPPAAGPIAFARFGEFVVMRQSDLRELLAAAERLRVLLP